MDQMHTPFFNEDGALRMRRFVTATLASAVVVAAVTAVLMHAAAPDDGWGVSLGIGAMIGFWMCPLFGALIGNGYHEAHTTHHK